MTPWGKEVGATEGGASHAGIVAPMHDQAAGYRKLACPKCDPKASLRSCGPADLTICAGDLSDEIALSKPGASSGMPPGIHVDGGVGSQPVSRVDPGPGTGPRDWRLPSKEGRARVARLRLLASFLVVVWVLAEIPFEIEASQGVDETAAVFVAKALVVVLALMAALCLKWAEAAFMFICALSVLAIAPSLYLEFKVSPVAFEWSSVECFVKALALVTYARACR